MNKKELVQGLKDKSPKAYSYIYRRYATSLYHYLFNIGIDKDNIYDLVQETFIKVYNSMDKFDDRYEISTWLYRIARNTAIDEHRKNRNKTFVELEEDKQYYFDNPTNNFDNKVLNKCVRKYVNRLPETEKELVILRYFMKFSYSEISNSLSMPLGSVKAKLFRARERLTKQFRRNETINIWKNEL